MTPYVHPAKKVVLQCISTKLFKICPNRIKSYFNALQNLQSMSACARDFQGRAETGCVYMATALKLALRLQIPQGLRGAGPVGAGAAWRLTGRVGGLVPLQSWNVRVLTCRFSGWSVLGRVEKVCTPRI